MASTFISSKISQRDGPQWNRRVAALAALLMAAILGWLIARIIWLLIPAPALPAWQPAAPKASQPVALQSASANLTKLASLSLFGSKVIEVEATEPAPVQDAPETKLKLVLSGIYVATDPQNSRAIIAPNASNPGKVYAIDAEISRGVSLHEIHANHVVLNRSGRYETLYLQKRENRPTNTSSTRSTAAANRSAQRTELSAEVGRELTDIRQQLLADPTKAGDLIRVQPVQNRSTKQFDGYRVYPGKDRALFRRVGLRSGDLVVGVNGQSLDDPAKGFAILNEITNATQLSLDIKRRGQTMTLFVDLNQ